MGAIFHRFSLSFAASLLGTVSACTSGSPVAIARPQPAAQALVTLSAIEGCDEAAAYVKEAMVRAMRTDMKAALASLEQGETCMASAVSAAAPSSGGGAALVSTTNNQVAGVDEADFVKNDSRYIYLAAGGAFQIVDAFPAAQAHVVARVPLEGEPRKLFIQGDRAFVYVARGTAAVACAYAGGCPSTGDGTTTAIHVFDISDRSAPVKLRDVQLSGALVAARRVGDTVHTVVAQQPSLPGLKTWPDGASMCSPPRDEESKALVRAQFASLMDENERIIRATAWSELLPRLQDSQGGAPACGRYYKSDAGDGAAFTSLVSLDMVHDGPITASTIVSKAGTVYASTDALYMAVSHERTDGSPWFGGYESTSDLTTVHAFRMGERPELTGYSASGAVKGRVLNQFSMDEWQGSLRIATTSGHLPDPAAENTLSVLAPVDGKLALRGAVEHIAPGEDIRSVRFEGDRGFVVTFKKTDPLYAVDLADPSAPKILGELKIPGFSTYMHRMDASHLLTIGYDADDQGDFAWFQGVIFQIFDVSDMTAPRLQSKVTIGTRGSSSEALSDHLAFNYFAPKGLLAVPMTICEGGQGGTYGTDMTFSGLMVYDATVEGGLRERGRVAHPQTGSGAEAVNACSNWWSNASSEVKRSVFMDDFVYSISEREIRVSALDRLAEPRVVLPIAP